MMETDHPCFHPPETAAGFSACRHERGIDADARQAFRELQNCAEDLALELTVRLRVLGKGLAAACQADGADTAQVSGLYCTLRQQFDHFLNAQADEGLSAQEFFPTVRHYLREFLPAELGVCGSVPFCRVQQVETVIALLSGSDRLLAE